MQRPRPLPCWGEGTAGKHRPRSYVLWGRGGTHLDLAQIEPDRIALADTPLLELVAGHLDRKPVVVREHDGYLDGASHPNDALYSSRACLGCAAADLLEAHVLRPDERLDLDAVLHVDLGRQRLARKHGAPAVDAARQHLGAAQKRGHEPVFGALVEFTRAASLLDTSVAQQHDVLRYL